jgi:cyclase
MSIRVMPALLVERGRLVKTRGFDSPRYVGDPRNTIRIFNQRDIDELVVLDISAGHDGRSIDWPLLEELASEAFVPAAYGGGVTNSAAAERVLKLGFEKVVLARAAMVSPELLGEIAAIAGRQAVVASLDFVTPTDGEPLTRLPFRGDATRSVVEVARRLEDAGAGEILLHDVSREGTRRGFNLEVIAAVSSAVGIPVVALGGATGQNDLRAAIVKGGASGVAAGSLFVFYGRLDAVLVNFPSEAELRVLFPERAQ